MPTLYYVDPSIAADSGTGTLGDPFGDLQYGLNTVSRNATTGDRFRLIHGTAEFLVTSLSLAMYGTPTEEAPLIIEGDDPDNRAEVDCNGVSMFGVTGAGPTIILSNLAIHNSSGELLALHATSQLIATNCKFYDASTVLSGTQRAYFLACHFHTFTDRALDLVNFAHVSHCYFEPGTYANPQHYIYVDFLTPQCGVIEHNVFKTGNDTDAIAIDSDRPWTVRNNTIYAASGTGTGITISNGHNHAVLNNYVEGFSGSGGHGYKLDSGASLSQYGFNSAYDNATNYAENAAIHVALGSNETLGSSALTNAAGDDFGATAALAGTAYPDLTYGDTGTQTYLDRGAPQREAGAPSSTPTNMHLHRRRRQVVYSHWRRVTRQTIAASLPATDQTILQPRRRQVVYQTRTRRRPRLFAAPNVTTETTVVVSRPRRIR